MGVCADPVFPGCQCSSSIVWQPPCCCYQLLPTWAGATAVVADGHRGKVAPERHVLFNLKNVGSAPAVGRWQQQ